MSAKIDVSSAVLAPSQSMTQFVLQQLLAGLNVRVTIGEKVYDGYVHNLDFARGADHVFASVCVSEPELGEYEGAGGFPSINVKWGQVPFFFIHAQRATIARHAPPTSPRRPQSPPPRHQPR